MAKKENAKKVNGKKEAKKKGHFFKDARAELKKVVWPTPKQLANSTSAVITIVLVCALIVFVLDMGFEAINKYGINKMQSALKERYSTSENVTEENTTTEATAQVTSENEANTTEDAQ